MAILLVTTVWAQVPGRGESTPAITAAATALKNPSMQVRIDAVAALGSMADEARLVVPWLVQALGDPADPVRRMAVLGLARLAATNPAALVPLTRALADKDPLVQDNAVWGLHAAGMSAVPALTDAIRAPETRVRVAALEVLHRIFASTGSTGVSAEVIETLIGALGDPDPDVRAASARSLGTLGSAAQAALLGLRTVSSTDNVDYVRAAAIEASHRIGKRRP